MFKTNRNENKNKNGNINKNNNPLFLIKNIQNILSPLDLNTSLTDDFNTFFNGKFNIIEEEPEQKQPIKFIATKVDSPDNQYLQQKRVMNLRRDRKKTIPNTGRWNKEEQRIFAKAVLDYGNNWKKIQDKFRSRTGTQIRSHAQKFLMKLRENKFVQEKGLNTKFCWTKTINFLQSSLTKEELKEVLFSVEEDKPRKSWKNCSKSNEKYESISLNEDNNDISNENDNESIDQNRNRSPFISNRRQENFFWDLNDKGIFNYKNQNEEEEKEKRIIRKFFLNFNNPLDDMANNTSFDENLSFHDSSDGFLPYTNNIYNDFKL